MSLVQLLDHAVHRFVRGTGNQSDLLHFRCVVILAGMLIQG